MTSKTRIEAVNVEVLIYNLKKGVNYKAEALSVSNKF